MMGKQEAAPQESAHPLEAMLVWRQQLVQSVLRALSILGFLALVVGSYSDYAIRLGRTIPFFVGAYAVLVLIAFWRRAPYVLRAGVLLFLFYSLGVISAVNSGLSGDVGIFLLAFAGLAALLLGWRWAVVTLLLCALTLAAFGVAFSARLLVVPAGTLVSNNTEPGSWLSTLVVFLMLGVLLALGQDYVFRRLFTALTRSHELTRELEADIAERRRAEAALRDSEAHYRRLFEDAVLGIFQSTPEGQAIAVNPAFARMFGYQSPEDVIAAVKNVATDLFADPQRRSEIMRLMAERPGLRTFESLYRRKDGSAFTGNLHVWPVRDADGRLLQLEGFIEDITERKRAEAALRESEFKFRSVVEQSTEGLVLVDEQGLVIEWNRALEEMTGVKREEAMGQFLWDVQSRFTVEELKTPESYERSKAVMLQVLQTGQVPSPSYPVESAYRRPDGSRGVVQQIVFPIKTDKGYRIGSEVSDITERRRAEEALRASEQKFRTFIEQSSEGIALVDEQGDIIEWNQAHERIIGLKRDEVIGKPFWEAQFRITPPERRSPGHSEYIKTVLLDAFRTGQSALFNLPIEGTACKPDGERKVIQQAIFPIKTDQGYRIGSMTRDITERKRAEEQIKASLAEKEVLLREIHHRVKNNLQVIASLLSLQAEHIQDSQALQLFQESQNRIRAMAFVHERLYQLDFRPLPELYALGDAHFNQLTGRRHDPVLVEPLTRLDGFLVKAWVAERFERDDDTVSHLTIKAVLIEECAPHGQWRRVTIS